MRTPWCVSSGRSSWNGSGLEPALAHLKQRDDLPLHDSDQPAGGLSPGCELGEAAHAHHLGPTRCGLALTASRPDDELADDETDDEQQHGGLEVVAAVDRERVVGTGEEEVERRHGHQRGDDSADPPTEHRGDHDHHDEHE